MIALEPSDAQVVAASIAALATIVVSIIAVVGVQLKVHRDNRNDHGETADKVDQLLEHQRDIQRDVTFIRADLTELHGSVRELRAVDRDSNDRITRLEVADERQDRAS